MRDNTVFVTFRKEGIHQYPAALEDPKLQDVFFLGYPHRHIFHFRVDVQVKHDDREIEFILLKRELEGLYDNGALQLNNASCEMLANQLLEYMLAKYPGRNYYSIEVSEDGENGATATYYV